MIRKTTHTKGPWQVLPEECDKPYIRVRGTGLGGRYKIANVMTPTFDGVPPCEAEETRRNAQLIAAAPELLAALEGLLRAVQSSVCAGSGPAQEAAQEAAQDALHKAVGAAQHQDDRRLAPGPSAG